MPTPTDPPAAAPPPLPHDASPAARALWERIRRREAVVAVIGMGYVGLPVARAVFDAGHRVIGFDIDPAKIERLRRGEMYIRHLGERMAADMLAAGRFEPTGRPERLAEADVVLLCVPTPLGEHHEPDLSAVLNSTRAVAGVLREGQLVVLESTTYPGTTRGEMLPILARAAAERGVAPAGEGFFLGFSPEREDPGRKGVATRQIPKITGGVDPVSGALTAAFYATCIERVHAVSSAEVAEASKLLENIFRSVNIALVNELKLVLDRMGIDVWEVIAASSTKPFGFMPFYPGPGLGGHCIPIDPFYLSWKAREVGHVTRFIELAGEINSSMPRHVVSRVQDALNEDRKPLNGSRVLVLGISYKPDIDDVRETPAAEIITLLRAHGAEVAYHDPHVPRFPPMSRYDIDLESLDLTPETLAAHDAAVIVTDHRAVDYALVGQHARLVIDTRNAMARARLAAPRARVVKA